MEKFRIPRAWNICPVEPDNVEILVFRPDAPFKHSLAGATLRFDVKNYATHFAQEFAANVFKVVMRAVKILPISEDHPGKSHRLVLNSEKSAHPT